MRFGRTLPAVTAVVLAVLGGCTGNAHDDPTATATLSERAATPPTTGGLESPEPTGPSSSLGPTPEQSSSSSIHFGPDSMPPLHPSVDEYPEGRARIQPSDRSAWDIPILLATSPENRAHGLMEVPEVPPATGMGFVFPRDTDGGFWMRGTKTDLDIAWFDANGVVVAMTTMEVCEADPCPNYSPGATYRYALEARAGWLGEIGLRVGDRIHLVDEMGKTPVGS